MTTVEELVMSVKWALEGAVASWELVRTRASHTISDLLSQNLHFAIPLVTFYNTLAKVTQCCRVLMKASSHLL